MTGKLDGTRAIAYKNKDVKIINRRNFDITHRYPEIASSLKKLKGSMVLDGEIVVLNEKGIPDFYLLSEREHTDNKLRIELLSKTYPAKYVVFDILTINGKKLLNVPLVERKKILEKVVKEGNNLEVCMYTENGVELFEVVKKMKMEGVMGKVKNSFYFPGERRDCWLKIKFTKTMDCVICGLTEGKGKREKLFGALVLGCYSDGKLKYVGKCGTGFGEKEMEEIKKSVKPGKCPFEEKPRLENVFWVKPELVCEVRYMNLSRKKIMRAPSFLRLRYNKPPEECEI